MQDDLNLIGNKSSGISKNQGIQYLIEIGLSRIQAILYLNLILHGETDAHNLASWTNAPRTEVYRTLNELQGKGLVDRKISCPLKFSAVPPAIGLQAVIDQKMEKINQMRKNVEVFSKEFQTKEAKERQSDYKITILEGRKRIIARIKQQHDQANSTVDIISSLPRFIQVADEVLHNYRKATDRGVIYRILIRLPNGKQELPKEILDTHANNNTLIKTMIGPHRVTSAVFDKEQASFSLYPENGIVESPYIVTNHPCLVEFAQNSFDKIWNSL